MKNIIVAIKDTKSGFLSPKVSVNVPVAIRDFEILVNSDRDSLISLCPEDYELYHIGEFDTDTGKIESLESPKFIIRGADVLKRGEDIGR